MIEYVPAMGIVAAHQQRVLAASPSCVEVHLVCKMHGQTTGI